MNDPGFSNTMRVATVRHPPDPLFCTHFLQGVQNLFLNSEGDNSESW